MLGRGGTRQPQKHVIGCLLIAGLSFATVNAGVVDYGGLYWVDAVPANLGTSFFLVSDFKCACVIFSPLSNAVFDWFPRKMQIKHVQDLVWSPLAIQCVLLALMVKLCLGMLSQLPLSAGAWENLLFLVVLLHAVYLGYGVMLWGSVALAGIRQSSLQLAGWTPTQT